jgi:hypothetical protein
LAQAASLLPPSPAGKDGKEKRFFQKENEKSRCVLVNFAGYTPGHCSFCRNIV